MEQTHDPIGGDTIEVELNGAEIKNLASAAASKTIGPRLSPVRQKRTFNLVLSFSGIALAMVGGVAYLTASAVPSTVETPGVTPQPEVTVPAPEPVQELPPVRFANPFDPKEVFEFPAGTTRAAARDAVAEILMERAKTRR